LSALWSGNTRGCLLEFNNFSEKRHSPREGELKDKEQKKREFIRISFFDEAKGRKKELTASVFRL
jgi:hypothetical protein